METLTNKPDTAKPATTGTEKPSSSPKQETAAAATVSAAEEESSTMTKIFKEISSPNGSTESGKNST